MGKTDNDFENTLTWALSDRRGGDDSTPVFASVTDQPYCRGCVTSTARTASPAYIAFLTRHHKEVRDGRE